MAKTTANISIDAETKRQAQELFAEFGMDLSTAVTIFFRQAIWEHAMPFEIRAQFFLQFPQSACSAPRNSR